LSKAARKPSVEYALAWLEKNGSKAGREGMARFNIPSDKAFGVPMGRVQALAKELGRSHELALALWETDRLEARMLCAYVDDPALVTAAQMDRWRRDFDNWAVVDTLCFALFDRTKDAWKMVDKWAKAKDEFGKRAAYALIWSLSVHDKAAGDAPFLKGARPHRARRGRRAPLREEGREHGPARHRQAQRGPQRGGDRGGAAAGGVVRGGAALGGQDALRELSSVSVVRRLAAR
jgi:3-methyladenine DNA glycosylase AlkD